MTFRLAFLTLFSTLLLSLWTAPALALDDAEVNQQIDGAINTHYASAQINEAERALIAIIDDCTGRCSPSVIARAWMYVGVVRGSGRDDLSGAKEAFAKAKAADPNVALDELFATDAVKEVFRQTPPGEAMPLMEDIRERAEAEDEVSEITCSLTISEVETYRPIPIACQVPSASSVVLSYRHESSTRWQQLPLEHDGSRWIGTIPCSDTRSLGVLSYRVQSFDAQGSELHHLGEETDALELNLVDETTLEPPALPGKEPPESCRPKKVEEVGPAGPKLGSYGDACSDSSQCQGGLTCKNGSCDADLSCVNDSDCFSGTCDDGQCQLSDCEGEDCSDRVSRNWFGVQGGMDFSMMSGSQVCGQQAPKEFSCFEGDRPYVGVPNENYAGQIDGGFQAATSRLMLSYERGLGEMFALETRVGFAFNGGPEADEAAGGDGSSFLPYHAEGRLKLYFNSAYRADGRGLPGASFFVMAGGGLAQVDPQVDLQVAECAPTLMITQAQDECRQSVNRAAEIKEISAVQRQGQGFVTVGLGMRYGFGQHFAALLNVNSMILLPSTGFTLSPSLGVAAGF